MAIRINKNVYEFWSCLLELDVYIVLGDLKAIKKKFDLLEICLEATGKH